MYLTGQIFALDSVQKRNLIGWYSNNQCQIGEWIYEIPSGFFFYYFINLFQSRPNEPPGVGGGGYSIFFRIRRLGPSIYRSPKKNIRNFKHPKKIFEILATQKNIPILYLDLKKRPYCIEMTLKLAQFCNDPKNVSTKSLFPQKNIHFSENPQKY